MSSCLISLAPMFGRCNMAVSTWVIIVLVQMFSVVWSSVTSENLCSTYGTGAVVIKFLFLCKITYPSDSCFVDNEVGFFNLALDGYCLVNCY